MWFLVRHLDTDGTFARYRRYDTDTHGSQGEHDIVLEALDLSNFDTRFRHDLIECDGRAHCSFDGFDLDAEVAQGGDDAIGVGLLLVFVNDWSRLVVVHLEQGERRELVVLKVFARVVWTEFLEQILRVVLGELDLFHLFYGDINRFFDRGRQWLRRFWLDFYLDRGDVHG